jgi:hypothetical protein
MPPPIASVGPLDRCVDDLEHHWGDVGADAIAFDVRDDGIVAHVERVILVDGDLLTGRNLDVLIRHIRLQVIFLDAVRGELAALRIGVQTGFRTLPATGRRVF